MDLAIELPAEKLQQNVISPEWQALLLDKQHCNEALYYRLILRLQHFLSLRLGRLADTRLLADLPFRAKVLEHGLLVYERQ